MVPMKLDGLTLVDDNAHHEHVRGSGLYIDPTEYYGDVGPRGGKPKKLKLTPETIDQYRICFQPVARTINGYWTIGLCGRPRKEHR